MGEGRGGEHEVDILKVARFRKLRKEADAVAEPGSDNAPGHLLGTVRYSTLQCNFCYS